jgi:glycogen operon protein
MLLAGDEFGQTQGGNNNTYAQDSEISWLHWDKADDRLIDAVSTLSALRKDLGLADSRFSRAPSEGDGPEVTWWNASGQMGADGWAEGGPFALRYHRAAEVGGDVLIAFNPDDDASFTLPEGRWHRRIDTATDPITVNRAEVGEVTLGWQSVVVWQLHQT